MTNPVTKSACAQQKARHYKWVGIDYPKPLSGSRVKFAC
ncbi:hypothetical protein NCHU2750_59570 (plasmid) [Neorhizobium sp. NCHU2750]|nr:hypothetical protein NCHU2750_59570 [Neorhizobium sp. NCHU2750]